MKKLLITTALIAATVSLATSALASDVGVSISIGQPGFYGQLDIGNYPQPQVMYAEPVVIDRRSSYGPPVYLRVPPGHAKHWKKHCREYNACGEQVYFVRDSWYNREYVPRYQERHRESHDDNDEHRHGEHGHGHGKGKGHDD